MADLFLKTALGCSKLITQQYSTSFTLGIRTLDSHFHFPIYAIYGFVRYADEIVDTFHQHDKAALLDRFRTDTFRAIEEGISLNPILHSFQWVVRQYAIDHELIRAFLHSMEMDLSEKKYSADAYQTYIYGSAEVVGLMCLYVFCEKNQALYERLRQPAQRLGSAFQKVNFLRDIQSDFLDRGRIYFPNLDFDRFDDAAKQQIEADIQHDFEAALQGIKQLPHGARKGVYLAYTYYRVLFQKIKHASPKAVQQQRIRIPNTQKAALLLQTYLRFGFGYR